MSAGRVATSTSPPQWAADLITTVCSDYGRRPPNVTWWRRDKWYSSGRTYKSEGRIHVTAGTSDVDARILVLHELAHWLGQPRWAHNRRYWELAWTLFIRYDVDLDWAIVRSAKYKTKALTYCPLVNHDRNHRSAGRPFSAPGNPRKEGR